MSSMVNPCTGRALVRHHVNVTYFSDVHIASNVYVILMSEFGQTWWEARRILVLCASLK